MKILGQAFAEEEKFVMELLNELMKLPTCQLKCGGHIFFSVIVLSWTLNVYTSLVDYIILCISKIKPHNHWKSTIKVSNSCKEWKTLWSYRDHAMNHGKNGNHTIIMTWIVGTMSREIAAMLSPWQDYEWHGSHVFPSREEMLD